jgi:hypothetical protein
MQRSSPVALTPTACTAHVERDASGRADLFERGSKYPSGHMSPTWVWMQIAIVVFVVIGMIVAITKLA